MIQSSRLNSHKNARVMQNNNCSHNFFFYFFFFFYVIGQFVTKSIRTLFFFFFFFFFLSLYTASRPHGHSRQMGAVVLKEEGKYRQNNKEGIVRG